MQLDLHNIERYDPTALAQMFNQAFAAYVAGSPSLDGEGVAVLLDVHQVDGAASRVVMADGVFAALALVARSGRQCRLAAMGVDEKHRGRGIGDHLVGALLADATARGDESMVLEVIEQNEPAVNLYLKHGFESVRRLCGWRIQGVTPSGAVPVESVERAEVVSALEASRDQHLPWQIALPNIARLPDDAVAVRHGGTYAVATFGESAILETLFSRGEALRVGEARACVAGLMSRFPAEEWVAPVRFPESYGTVFDRLAARQPLTQWQMERRL